MAAYVKFLAGYLEKMEYRYQKKDQLVCVTKLFGAPKLHLTDIAAVEIANEENVKKLGGTLGGALVGGVLLGGIGAIVGGMAGGGQKESTIICTFKDGQRSLAKVNGPMLEAIQTHLFKLEQNPHYADEKAKKKTPIWQQIVVAIVILIVLAAVFGGKSKTEPAAQPAAVQEDPCEGIKTMADWDKASEIWKLSHSECKPQ